MIVIWSAIYGFFAIFGYSDGFSGFISIVSVGASSFAAVKIYFLKGAFKKTRRIERFNQDGSQYASRLDGCRIRIREDKKVSALISDDIRKILAEIKLRHSKILGKEHIEHLDNIKRLCDLRTPKIDELCTKMVELCARLNTKEEA